MMGLARRWLARRWRGLRYRTRMALAIVVGLAAASAAVFWVSAALERGAAFFLTPTEVLAASPSPTRVLRVGGLVVAGSVRRLPDGETRFLLTDGGQTLEVSYTGALPPMFAPRQGLIVEGVVREGRLRARRAIARHDENYRVPKPSVR